MMANAGYKDAGYEYVIIDDCGLAMERDAQGRLQPDPYGFPMEIKKLADYVRVHSYYLRLVVYPV